MQHLSASRGDIAALVLSFLLKRGVIQGTIHEGLMDCGDPASVAFALHRSTVAATAVSNHSTRSHVHTGGSPPRALVRRHSPSAVAHLLKGLPGEESSTSCRPAQLVCLGASDPLRAAWASPCVCLPTSLAEVAAYLRTASRKKAERRLMTSTTSPSIMLIEEGAAASLRRACVDAYCATQSKDLIVTSAPPSLPLEQYLQDSITVAECVLKATGSLLMVSRAPIPPPTRRFLKWRFRQHQYHHHTASGAYYAVCRELTTEDTGAAVSRHDFPGFCPPGERRPKKWNPYRRGQHQKFVTSVRPSFTNALYTKDALRRSVERERDTEAELQRADDAFFSVVHEMVEKGSFSVERND